VVVEGYNKYDDVFVGRSYRSVPEIDGLVFFTGEKEMQPGDFVDVDIFDVDEYDLRGETF